MNEVNLMCEYLVFDILTNRPAGVPFFCPTDVSAVREIANVFKENVKAQPRQFELYRLSRRDGLTYDFVDTEKVRVCGLGQVEEYINTYLDKQGIK